jgi:hypothetical protein
MKRVLVGVLLGLCLVATGRAEDGTPGTQRYLDRDLGYRFETGQVVFEFDPSDYANVTRDADGAWLTIGDVRIDAVAVAGDFNQWSKTAWPMTEVRGGVYELRRQLGAFEGRRDWSFKFVVNGSCWVEPPEGARNRVRSGFWAVNRSYDLLLRVPLPAAGSGSESGGVTLEALGQLAAATSGVCVLKPVEEISGDSPFPVESNPFSSTDPRVIRFVSVWLLPPTGSGQGVTREDVENLEREARLIEAVYVAVYESCSVYGLQFRDAIASELRARFEAQAHTVQTQTTIVGERLVVLLASDPQDTTCYDALRAHVRDVLAE